MPSITPHRYLPHRYSPVRFDRTPPSTSTINNEEQLTLSEKTAKNLTRNNYKIKDRNNDGRIDISYTFYRPSDPHTSWLNSSQAIEFSEARKAAFRRSIQAWEDVAKVKFTENAKGADAEIIIHGNNGTGGYAVMPNDSGRANIGIGLNTSDQLNASMIHELGHSMGLQHPEGDYPENNHTHTAMSYTNKWWRPADKHGVYVSESPSTPMMHDIASIQHIYGANTEIRKGDTVYGFNSNTGRQHYSLRSPQEKFSFCVWDGGGNDTLDFSGFNHNQKINLNAETLSDVGGRQSNVSIAKNVVVENAIGGKGHDVIIGNHVSNRITGGPGGDRQTGGQGADTFVYDGARDSPLENPDTLVDFISGVDKIDLSKVLRDAGIQRPIITSVLTDQAAEMSGRKGELVLDYDVDVKLHRLILNVGGNAKSVLLILSRNPIKPTDIVTGANLPSNRIRYAS